MSEIGITVLEIQGEEDKQKRLNLLVEKWQKTLRLQDWDIKAKFGRNKDMPKRSNVGSIYINDEPRFAEILVIEERDYDGKDGVPYWRDVEDTVIHELLHIYFHPFDTKEDTPQRLAEEQVIHMLSAVFLRLQGEHSGTTPATTA